MSDTPGMSLGDYMDLERRFFALCATRYSRMPKSAVSGVLKTSQTGKCSQCGKTIQTVWKTRHRRICWECEAKREKFGVMAERKPLDGTE